MARNAFNFCFTAYNWTPTKTLDILSPIVDNGVFQEELCPTTNRTHIQGYFKTKSAFSYKKLKEKLGADIHLEATRSVTKSIKYCTKAETRISGPYPIGNIHIKTDKFTQLSEYISRGDIRSIREQCFPLLIRHRRNILEELSATTSPSSFKHTRGIWLCGPSGIGKTRFIHQQPDLYIKPHNKWWDGYTGHRLVCGDDWDQSIWKWGLNYIKTWADHYPTRGETKGGTIYLNYEWFMITSNITLDESLIDIPTSHHTAIKRRFIEIKTDDDWQTNLSGLIHPSSTSPNNLENISPLG